MKSWFLGFFYILFLIVPAVNAKEIDITKESQRLLAQSSLYYDQDDRPFADVKREVFTPATQDYINRAFDAKTVVWVKLELINLSERPIERILEVTNPILDHVTLYDLAVQKQAGMLHVQPEQDHINPSFIMHFDANEQRTVWLKVENRTTALQFELFLKSEQTFHRDDLACQNSIMLFLGMILAFLALALLLYLYLQDVSYLYYGFYLLTLLFQQMTYVGYLPLHAPRWFTEIDNLIMVPKISIMIIAAALYAMHFLTTEQFPKLHRIYRLLIVVLLVQIPLIGTTLFYVPEVTVFTGLFFIIFNTYAGIYVYIHGNKQARFFIAGWLVLIVSYLVLIMDSLGVISVMHYLPTLLMWATAIEALLLLLAFVDRFSILQVQKEQLNEEFVLEYNLRQKIIENEVEEKTDKLSQTLAQKEMLFKELHHRVKNNLQLIMSIIRLQHDYSNCDEESDVMQRLEGRIGAIARTHELLYQQSGDEVIDMQEYVDEFVEGMESTLAELNIEVRTYIEAKLPLKEAGYVGLIINELVSNAVKYAYDDKGGTVYVRLKSTGQVYTLEVSDEGKGYNPETIEKKSLGRVLVSSLVEEQLDGSLELDNSKGTHYVMRFVV